MNAERFQLKLFSSRADVDLEPFVPVFHRWIREKLLPELMLDVVDYRHVHHGPGVVLIGHASDYYVDQDQGRVGLVFSRKRQGPEPEGRLADGLRRLFHAARLLEQESLTPALRFDSSEILVRVTDRLRAPNTAEAFGELRAELVGLLARVYGGLEVGVSRVEEPNAPLTARVSVAGQPTLGAVLEQLGGPPTD